MEKSEQHFDSNNESKGVFVSALWYKITCKKQCCCPSLNLPVPHSSKLAMRPIENTRIRAALFPVLPLPFGGFLACLRE
jgi:hypothetical protein